MRVLLIEPTDDMIGDAQRFRSRLSLQPLPEGASDGPYPDDTPTTDHSPLPACHQARAIEAHRSCS
jgi:hypothetical protein